MKITSSTCAWAVCLLPLALLMAGTTVHAQQIHVRLLDAGSTATFQTGAYRVTGTLGLTSGRAFLHLTRLAQAGPAAEAASLATAEALPTTFSLEANYPNPFNPQTTIRFGLPEASPVRLEVFDVLGRRVAVLANETLPAGWHALTFDARSLPSGVYFSRIEAGAFHQTRRMTLVK